MVPIDDPSWPACPDSCPQGSDSGWCEHVRTWLIDNKDAYTLAPGANYCIPVSPTYGQYAEVNLAPEKITEVPVMVQMSLIKPSDDPWGDDEFVTLGLHTEGEGRLIIATIVEDWIRATYDGKPCKWHNHSLPQENLLNRGTGEPAFDKANHWCLAFYGKCYPCRLKELGLSAPPVIQGTNARIQLIGPSGELTGASIPVTFDAKSFGIGDVSAPRDNTANQAAAREALRQRFGNRNA